ALETGSPTPKAWRLTPSAVRYANGAARDVAGGEEDGTQLCHGEAGRGRAGAGWGGGQPDRAARTGTGGVEAGSAEPGGGGGTLRGAPGEAVLRGGGEVHHLGPGGRDGGGGPVGGGRYPPDGGGHAPIGSSARLTARRLRPRRGEK